MKNIFINSLLVSTLVLTSCASQKNTGVWVNGDKIQGKSFSKVFIVVMSADIEARAVVEADLAKAAVSRGLQAVKSIEAIPPSMKNPAEPARPEIAAQVKATGCDAVLIASLLRKEEDIRYTPGTTAYSVLPYYTWHGNLWGYYNHFYPRVYTPGYYEQEKVYFMQTNLYDVASEEIMWSVQSGVFNPTSLARFSKNYTATLAEQLQKEGLIKK